MNWCWYSLEEMPPLLMYDLLALRESIFVVEQACIYHELDGLDKIAEHLVGSLNGAVLACLRVLPPGAMGIRARIGRVAVSPDWRKRGIARLMVRDAIDRIRRNDPLSGIRLDAQSYLKGFYQSLDFEVCGDEFLEDGIPHVPMQM
ncbi:MAG: GNAT family N-acetyltransferase [Lysobacterales bacterium]